MTTRKRPPKRRTLKLVPTYAGNAKERSYDAYWHLRGTLSRQTTKNLAALARSVGSPIRKYKCETVEALVDSLRARGATVDFTVISYDRQ
jgi:hypothetical protein